MEIGIEEGKIILKSREMANNAKISIYGTFMSNQNPKKLLLSPLHYFYCCQHLDS